MTGCSETQTYINLSLIWLLLGAASSPECSGGVAVQRKFPA